LITPRIVPLPLLVLFAALWMLLARIVLFIGYRAAGVLPTVGA
jgi:hypothetical protein